MLCNLHIFTNQNAFVCIDVVKRCLHAFEGRRGPVSLSSSYLFSVPWSCPVQALDPVMLETAFIQWIISRELWKTKHTCISYRIKSVGITKAFSSVMCADSQDWFPPQGSLWIQRRWRWSRIRQDKLLDRTDIKIKYNHTVQTKSPLQTPSKEFQNGVFGGRDGTKNKN